MKILATIDFSPASDVVLEETLRLANALGAEVSLLHVTPPAVEPIIGFQSRARMEAEAGHDQSRLQSYAEPLRRSDLVVRVRSIAGEPGPAILEAIDAEKPDLTIVGTHGRTGLAHFVMGSVAEYVVRRASRPVLVIPPTLQSAVAAGG